MADSTAAALASSALFSDLSEPVLERLAGRVRRRTYRKGHIVFTTGDPSDTLALLLSGRVKISARSADGGELLLTLLRPGATFGELGIIDGGPRSADAEMLEEGEVLLIPSEAVNQLMGEHPGMAAKLLRSVTAGFRRLTDATADLVFLDLPRRLAKVLLDRPTTPAGTVDLALNQEQLAHLVGGSRQSVNSALRGFERRGWISVAGSHITLRNVESLQRFAG